MSETETVMPNLEVSNKLVALLLNSRDKNRHQSEIIKLFLGIGDEKPLIEVHDLNLKAIKLENGLEKTGNDNLFEELNLKMVIKKSNQYRINIHITKNP